MQGLQYTIYVAYHIGLGWFAHRKTCNPGFMEKWWFKSANHLVEVTIEGIEG